MRKYLRVIPLLSALVLTSGVPARGQTVDETYHEWVEYRDGEISLTFERIPIQFALHAIYAKTGFRIAIPSNNANKSLSLRLDRQPFEPAMRSLISTIGYKNFALMYDDNGRPNRAVVLGAQAQTEPAARSTAESDTTPRSLTADEREKLQKDLARWSDLRQEERGRIEDRLKSLPVSDEREQLVKQYGQEVLGLSK